MSRFVDEPGKFKCRDVGVRSASSALRPPSTCRVKLDDDQIYETRTRHGSPSKPLCDGGGVSLVAQSA
jgi:hypothetical protein